MSDEKLVKDVFAAIGFVIAVGGWTIIAIFLGAVVYQLIFGG
jgi:hypothetical protein